MKAEVGLGASKKLSPNKTITYDFITGYKLNYTWRINMLTKEEGWGA
jgi:hypothetical protein